MDWCFGYDSVREATTATESQWWTKHLGKAKEIDGHTGFHPVLRGEETVPKLTEHTIKGKACIAKDEEIHRNWSPIFWWEGVRTGQSSLHQHEGNSGLERGPWFRCPPGPMIGFHVQRPAFSSDRGGKAVGFPGCSSTPFVTSSLLLMRVHVLALVRALMSTGVRTCRGNSVESTPVGDSRILGNPPPKAHWQSAKGMSSCSLHTSELEPTRMQSHQSHYQHPIREGDQLL